MFKSDIEVEDRSVYELLRLDDRVDHDLAVSLVTALFRTGIDSVSYRFRDNREVMIPDLYLYWVWVET